ncbi:MAG: adenylate/guanylate cyclase domain-containing protein [Alphaproteobacteria bacterium]
MNGRQQRKFIWHFDNPVEDIWPIMADTARFNEAAGLPKHDIEEIPQPGGSVRYFATAKVGPMSLVWEDHPVNWVENRWFRHRRSFRNGPLKSLDARLDLFPEETGCRGEYTLQAEAANLAGRLILATRFFSAAERDFTRLANDARDFAAGRSAVEFNMPPPALPDGARDRAKAAVAKIEASPHGHGLAVRLADYLMTRQEVDVMSIRPLKLARDWNRQTRETIELCLQAAKDGLLSLRWDLLCPRCQIGKVSVLALDQLPEGAHCPSCNIDYGRDYTKNLELVFQPSAAIRPVDSREYCLFGPISTPHVKTQLTLEPGEDLSEKLDLPYGFYRLRTLEPGPEHVFEWRTGPFPDLTVSDSDMLAEPPAPSGAIRFRNTSSRRLTLILEEQEWKRDALTAHRATTLQAFRDLFDEDVLRPGDDVAIDYVAMMFTDLKGSTALYERIGDSQAYHLIREHFAILGKAVRENNGAVVKTIGDAIMGAFADPADALKCAIQIQKDFETYNASSGKEPAIITIGLHVGRCISVTLNNRLDYYGTAANKAARLEGQSTGGDIVLSEEMAQDPGVAALLNNYKPETGETALKGFNTVVPFLRLTADDLAAFRKRRKEQS